MDRRLIERLRAATHKYDEWALRVELAAIERRVRQASLGWLKPFADARNEPEDDVWDEI